MLHNLVCIWLFKAGKVICDCSHMIINKWEKCGLLRAFERTFQASAMEENAKCSFLAQKAFDTIESEEFIKNKDYNDLEDLFDAEVMDMMAKCL